MRREQFLANAPGNLVDITDELGNRGISFVPLPLPSDLDLGSKRLRIALSEADRDLARLDGIARQIQQPELLFQNYLRREALLSSKIEGTRTTLAQLALFEVAGQGGNDAIHVQNYVQAYEYGRTRCVEIPVGIQLLNEIHQILMGGSDQRFTTPGTPRNCTALIGSAQLDTARFVPPPHGFVRELLENLEHFLESNDEPPLLKLAMAHYQFETIHPYRDGNGRVGRLLISLFLHRKQILSAPMLYISAFFEREQEAYYDALLRVSTKNAWEEWILFFFEAVSTQARDAVDRTRRLVALREKYHGLVRRKQRSQAIHELVDQLFIVPVMSVPIAQRRLGLTYAGAKPHVTRLIESGILKSEPITVNNTAYYVATELVHTLEAPIAQADDAHPEVSKRLAM